MIDNKIFEKVAKELNLSKAEVKKMYYLWWKEIRDTMSKLDPQSYTKDQFTDFNIPYFGKIIFNIKKTKKIDENSKAQKNKTT